MFSDIKNIKFKNFIGLFFAGVINAIGVALFISPAKLYDSGISGTSIFLSQITPFSLSVWLLILNVPLFLFGLKKQGICFTIYAIFTVVIYSLSAYVITDVLHLDFTNGSPLAGGEVILCVVFGGLISGVGSGLAIRFGGAMDGVEVMAVVFAKKIGISIGTFVMIYNAVLYIVAGIVLSGWVLPLYSVVTYMIGLKAVDFVVDGIDRSKSASIVTSKPDEVCKALSQAFGHGMTTYQARGYYSNENKTIVYIILNRFQISKMREIVKQEDAEAYISITDVADVFSRNK